MGGAGACGNRPRLAARFLDRRLRGCDVQRLRVAAGECSGGLRGAFADGHDRECPVGSGCLHVRSRGAGGDAGHGVFLLAGGGAPGRSGAAPGRVLDGTRRRCHRDVHADDLRRVLASARSVAGRDLQVVRGFGGRYGLGRGRGRAGAGASVGRSAARAQHPGCDPWFRGQPGRCEQRPHRPQRALAGTRHAPGPRQRPPRSARGGRGRGARHRYPAR